MSRKELAKKIAEYITEEGTRRTLSGSYHFEFEDINELFDTDLPNDEEMLDMIWSCFDPDIVQECITDEDFDMMFYLKYCNLDNEEE